MSGHDDRRELGALEAELRADQMEDPGDPFFADLEARVMREVTDRSARRRPWWHPATLWRWVWQPAPVAALAGAAAVVLVVIWVGGPGGPASETMISLPGTEVAAGDTVPGSARPASKHRASPGDAWLARLPPTEDLYALEAEALPALLALVSAEDPGEDEEGSLPPLGVAVDRLFLERLTQAQLRALERALDQKKPQQKSRSARPRPAMGKAG
jgi:hypothetical protein